MPSTWRPARGLLSQLAAYPREDGLITDVLVYADMTSGPDGQRIHLRERLLDVRHRHASGPPARAQARRLREPHLVMAVARVDVALLRDGRNAHLGLPLPPGSTAPGDVVERLAQAQPARHTHDLRAAVHAAASLLAPTCGSDWAVVVEHASRLLSAPTGTRYRHIAGHRPTGT